MTYVSNRFNPSNPAIAGAEWGATANHTLVPTSGVAYGCTIVSTASETIDTIDTILMPPGGTLQPFLQCDVYDLANPVLDAQNLVLAKPVDNYFNGADWQKWVGGTFTPYDSNAWQDVDDIVALNMPNGSGSGDAVIYNGVNPSTPNLIMFNAGATTLYDGHTGASGAVLSGQRVAWVEVCVIVANETAQPMFIDGYLQKAGGSVVSSDTGPRLIPPNSGDWRAQFGFYTNAFTTLPWNQTDSTGLTTGGYGFGIGVTSKPAAGNFAVEAMMLQFIVQPERRLATGFGFGLTSAPVWGSFALASPATYGAASWSKTTAHEYLIVFTGLRSAASVVYISPDNVIGLVNGSNLTGTNATGLTLGQGLVPAGVPQVGGPSQLPLLMEHSGVASVDSNPYAQIAISDSTVGHTQGISVESAQAYGTITMLIGSTSNGAGGPAQNAPLSISLHKTSDNSTLLGPTNINPGDIPADGNFYIHSVQLGSTTLTANEPVNIQVTSTSNPPWLLPAMFHYIAGIATTEAHVVMAEAVGIGGTADTADSTASIDFPWSIATVPTAPGSFAGSVGTMSAAAPPPGGPSVIHYAHLTWTATSMGGSFGYYELQRQDGSAWNDIAIITTEANAFFNDVEAIRGVASPYRLRAIRNDGAVSAWTSTVPVTVPTAQNCDLVLASNWDPTKSLAFQENGDGTPTHTFARANAQSTVVHIISGRQAPVAFRPLIEGNSDVFERTLIVAMDTAGNPVTNAEMDRAAFDALLSLIEDPTVPYVAVMDGHGRRWFTFPEFVSGSYTWNGHEHDADVKFTEVAMVPTAPTYALPPTP